MIKFHQTEDGLWFNIHTGIYIVDRYDGQTHAFYVILPDNKRHCVRKGFTSTQNANLALRRFFKKNNIPYNAKNK